VTAHNPFKFFKTSPKIIRLAVMYDVRYPLSFRQVEDVLHERGIDICMKLYGFGWIGLVQNMLRQFERRGRVNTQTGNGI
jgi:putative transposase